jgi:hypothetical protein
LFILQATNEYFTGDGNLAKIIIDIYKKNWVANYILLIQKFEVYDENLNRLLKIIEIFVDNKIRRINRIIVEKYGLTANSVITVKNGQNK